MSFVPNDITPFYGSGNFSSLFQGDILDANALGLKDTGSERSPDYYIVLTKSCDLAFRMEEKVLKNKGLSLLPLLSFRLFSSITRQTYKKRLSEIFKTRRILLAGLIDFPRASSFMTHNQIDSLIKGDISKLMFLPPEGKILNNPLVIDFDLVTYLDASTEDEVVKILNSKRLQLSSPFREKFAQRFAMHYMSIGIDDDFIRTNDYKKQLKEYLKSITPTI